MGIYILGHISFTVKALFSFFVCVNEFVFTIRSMGNDNNVLNRKMIMVKYIFSK